MDHHTAYQIARSHQRELIAEAERARRAATAKRRDSR
jgi:hypothetical protein